MSSMHLKKMIIITQFKHFKLLINYYGKSLLFCYQYEMILLLRIMYQTDNNLGSDVI